MVSDLQTGGYLINNDSYVELFTYILKILYGGKLVFIVSFINREKNMYVNHLLSYIIITYCDNL